MKNYSFYSFLFSVIIFGLATACGPVTTEPDDKETDSSKDHSFSQNEFDAITQAFDAEASNSGILNKTEGTASYFCDCASTSVLDNQNGTYTLTIDFGTGCFCLDGRKREGKLTGIFSGKWNQSGTSVTITPENYSVTAVSGTKYTFDFTQTITYEGLNTNGNRVYHTVMNNATMTDTDNHTIRWSCNRTVEWIEGFGNPDPTTYRYLVTGNASGTASNDVSFTATITTPLEIRNSCEYRIVSGVLELLPTGSTLVREIHYGNGECDNKAELIMGSFNTTLVLR